MDKKEIELERLKGFVQGMDFFAAYIAESTVMRKNILPKNRQVVLDFLSGKTKEELLECLKFQEINPRRIGYDFSAITGLIIDFIRGDSHNENREEYVRNKKAEIMTDRLKKSGRVL
jgi:hypothetical protein